MKKCPYCAEMIQDEAIKCRYCFSDLRVAPGDALGDQPPATAPSPATAAEAMASSGGSGDSGARLTDEASPSPRVSPPGGSDAPSTVSTSAPTVGDPAPLDATPTPEPGGTASSPDASPVSSGAATAVRYTHSGYRYVLGYGSDFFGIWDRQSPSAPAERFTRSDDGWRQAWLRFAGLEPNHVAVPGGGPDADAPVAPTIGDGAAEQYTHSGSRYLLGYGKDFFGIWDRQDPSRAVERFPRTDPGWADAWRRYTQIESHFSEVSLGKPSGA